MCPGCVVLAILAPPGAVVGRRFLPAGQLPRPVAHPPRPALGNALPVPPLALGLLALIVGLILFGPGTLQYKLDVLGFAVCHQIVSHSFVIGGHPLPVCARCSGIYLGAITTGGLLAVLRPRATGLPSPQMLTLLALMFLAMVADGVNSTFQSLPGGQGLWETTNLLRIVTGALAGMAIAFLLYPIFNATFWRRELLNDEPVLDKPFELIGFAAAVAALVGLTLSASGDAAATPIYWIIALLSVAGFLLLLTLANTLIVAGLTRREGLIGSWRTAASPLLIALLLAIGELVLLASLRGELVVLIGTASLPPGMPAVAGVR